MSHDEGVRGLGVHGRDPARRSFPQNTWLPSTASVHQDQAQSFYFPLHRIKCATCRDVGVGSRKWLDLFCLTTPCCSSWQEEQRLQPSGEVKLQGVLSEESSIFICPSSASHWKDRMTSSCKCQGEITMKWCNNMRPWKALVCQCCSHYTKATFSVLICQPRKSTQRSASEDLSQLVTSH